MWLFPFIGVPPVTRLVFLLKLKTDHVDGFWGTQLLMEIAISISINRPSAWFQGLPGSDFCLEGSKLIQNEFISLYYHHITPSICIPAFFNHSNSINTTHSMLNHALPTYIQQCRGASRCDASPDHSSATLNQLSKPYIAHQRVD